MAKRWYIIHAYSNFENKVAESIREQAKQRGLSDLFEEVMVPKEKVVEVRRGRKVDAERKFFPGYVLAKMDLTDEAFHLIKNTPKVTGFLGADNKPTPISDVEADRILHQVRLAKSNFGFGWVRVDVDIFEGHLEENDHRRKHSRWQHVAISIRDRS